MAGMGESSWDQNCGMQNKKLVGGKMLRMNVEELLEIDKKKFITT